METTNTASGTQEPQAEEVFICINCEKHFLHESEGKYDDDDWYCQDCFDDEFCICSDCGEYVRQDDTKEVQDDYVCNECYNDNDYFYCDQCDRHYPQDNYGGNGLCEDCYNDETREENDEDSSNDQDRKYSKDDSRVESGKRAFSCEIECYYPEDDYQKVRDVLASIDSGIGMSHDGSLNNYGKEFQTPKLSGKKGKDILKNLCDELNANEFHVDRTCGLHIHLDTSDLAGRIEKLKKLILFYMIIEPLLYSYLPFSRRANRYCMPLSEFYHEDEIKNVCDISQLETIWYREQSHEKIERRKNDRYDSTRYAGINLHSLLSNGHIEIRHHSGTIDYQKIQNWIDLHVRILDVIEQDNISLDNIIKLKYILSLSQKQTKVFELLNLEPKLQKYFTARNKKFGNELEDHQDLCAE